MSVFFAKRSVFFMSAVFLSFIDQGFKWWALESLQFGTTYTLIPNFISLQLLWNTGISFGVGAEFAEHWRIPGLIILTLVIICAISWYIITNYATFSRVEKIAFVLILGGALGNFYDRAFREGVVDYMYFHFFEYGFFVNNFADDIISIGFVLLLVASFRSKNSSPQRKKASASER